MKKTLLIVIHVIYAVSAVAELTKAGAEMTRIRLISLRLVFRTNFLLCIVSLRKSNLNEIRIWRVTMNFTISFGSE